MPHDVIDNRSERLMDRVLTILSTTERARFAVGFFFLSGLKPFRDKLQELKEVRILTDSITNPQTLEVLAEGRKRLELVESDLEKLRYQRRVDMKRSAEETIESMKEAMALTDQTDDEEETVRTVLRLMEEKRLKVRLYTKGRLHAKAYIFDYGQIYDKHGNSVSREEKGIAIVGSSNLSLAGLKHNTELNVVVHGNPNHTELSHWFEELWAEAQDFDELLMDEMRKSWAVAKVSPYDIYMKTLYELVKDQLEEAEEGHEILWDDEIVRDLADFQKVAVRQAIQMIRSDGGCFVADVVGLGKSYIGAAVMKHFERIEHARPLIICPKGLVKMWERYNETYELNARVLSIGLLQEREDRQNTLLEDELYKKRDFVVVDESHNFRNLDTQRYRILQDFLARSDRKCLLLTATPRAKSAWDIYHQIKLFHQDDRTFLPIDPPHLRDFFRKVESGERNLQDVLTNLLIRRTRSHILRWYGFDSETHERINPKLWNEYRDGHRRAYILVSGKRQFFPERDLQTITYSIEDTYQGLYRDLRRFLGHARQNQTSPPPDELTYARYGLWHYVTKEKQGASPYAELHQAGANIRGLIRIMLFKRFESSVQAFRETLRRLLRMHQVFLEQLTRGSVAAGEEAQTILYESDRMEETQLNDALRAASGRYRIDDFDVELLRQHIEQDIHVLKRMLDLVAPITPDSDAKLKTLKEHLGRAPLSKGKRLIFTQYADTAQYLYDNLNPNGKRDDIDVIYSGEKSRERVVGRFAPKANKWYRPRSGEIELQTVVATDVLAEGLNLQDCDKVINYDLHWNPVRLIQRFGRIDRIGSDYERIFAFNFLPELGIERQLDLHAKLRSRIAEIHETIGEDAAILDPAEQLNEQAMYAIYEQTGNYLNLFEEQEEEPMDHNEIEQFLRQLRQEDPNEFKRIVSLRDGIRTSRTSATNDLFAFFRAGGYRQVLLLDKKGNIISRNPAEILKVISCTRDEPARALPHGHNAAVMKVKQRFEEEVKYRETELRHTTSLTLGQRYVLRELRVMFNANKDEELRRDIVVMEEAFRRPVTVATRRDIDRLRRNAVTGEALLSELRRVYAQHNLKDVRIEKPTALSEETPRIVCSEALVQDGGKVG